MTRGIAVVVGLLLACSACMPKSAAEVVPGPRAGVTPQRGGTLRIGVSPPPLSLEPTNAGDPSSQLVLSAMCDPLFEIDPKTGRLKPAVARAVRIQEKGRKFFINLRRGVRFHDGTEVRSQDVAYALSRIARQDYASTVAPLISSIRGFSDLNSPTASQEAERARTEFEETLNGVRIVDNYSLEITLAGSRSVASFNAEFSKVLAHVLTSPIPRAAVIADELGFARKPVCAGPYRMTKPYRTGDTSITLERFNGYYGKNVAFTGGGRGYPDRIEFRLFSNDELEYQELLAGNLDVAHVPRSRLAEATAAGGLVQTATGRLDYIGLPVNLSPFTDRHVRKALVHALDRQALIDQVYAGTREVATGFFPPALSDVHRPNACGELLTPNGNESRAREELARTNLTMPRLQFFFNEEAGNRAVAQAAADRWRSVLGIEADLHGLPWDQFLVKGTQLPGFEGPFKLTWPPQIASPDSYLFPLLSSSMVGLENFSSFHSTRFDRRLTNGARISVDDDARAQEYRSLEKMVCDEMPLIPIGFAKTSVLMSSGVGYASDHPADRFTGEPEVRELFKAPGAEPRMVP